MRIIFIWGSWYINFIKNKAQNKNNGPKLDWYTFSIDKYINFPILIFSLIGALLVSTGILLLIHYPKKRSCHLLGFGSKRRSTSPIHGVVGNCSCIALTTCMTTMDGGNAARGRSRRIFWNILVGAAQAHQ